MELSLPMPWPVGRCLPHPSAGNNSFYSSGNLVKLLLIFSISPLFPTQGIVATCSAPVAVTRRCPFPASSSSSPAESANPATAASSPAAPAWTSNWTSPSLPRPTEPLAWERRGSHPSPRARGARGPRLGGPWGQTSRTCRWIVGFSLSSSSPFPACPVRVSVSPRVRVCVYNNISVCLREARGGGEGAGAQPGAPWVFICPTVELLQAEGWREQREPGRPEGRASIAAASSAFNHSCYSKPEIAVWEPVAARRGGNLLPQRPFPSLFSQWAWLPEGVSVRFLEV